MKLLVQFGAHLLLIRAVEFIWEVLAMRGLCYIVDFESDVHFEKQLLDCFVLINKIAI